MDSCSSSLPLFLPLPSSPSLPPALRRQISPSLSCITTTGLDWDPRYPPPPSSIPWGVRPGGGTGTSHIGPPVYLSVCLSIWIHSAGFGSPSVRLIHTGEHRGRIPESSVESISSIATSSVGRKVSKDHPPCRHPCWTMTRRTPSSGFIQSTRW